MGIDMVGPLAENCPTSKVRYLTTGVVDSSRAARLTQLEMLDFKCFKAKTIQFNTDEITCIIGQNSSGKSSVIDAIKFLILHPDSKEARSLVRRCCPVPSKFSVLGTFETEESETLLLGREVFFESPTECRLVFTLQTEGKDVEDISEARYASLMEKLVGKSSMNIFLEQFGLLKGKSAERLLQEVPRALELWNDEYAARRPMLKRSKSSNMNSDLSGLTSSRTNAEAWVSRRLDEIYRELSKVPLDDDYQTWSDGGQACLRRLSDGSFTIFVSQKRGLAALGHGSPLTCLSDGDRDLCALALLLTLTNLQNACLTDAFPDFIILDDPDSRLDKRAAKCLLSLLSGPSRPKQCVITSLNNHGAYTDQSASILLPEEAIARQENSALREVGETIYRDGVLPSDVA